jgi:glyoxylase-like metal-dependent hydrolase (beta-lactamase superfamily II)
LAEPIVQPPEQATITQLARHGYRPEDMEYVFITHLHFDHVDQLELTNTWKDRVIATDDAEVVPGIRVMWIGGHTPCSQAICVQTAQGEAILTGDTVSLLANIEKQIPMGIYHNLEECRAALKKLAQRDAIILPSHDPGVFDRFPEGVIE